MARKGFECERHVGNRTIFRFLSSGSSDRRWDGHLGGDLLAATAEDQDVVKPEAGCLKTLIRGWLGRSEHSVRGLREARNPSSQQGTARCKGLSESCRFEVRGGHSQVSTTVTRQDVFCIVDVEPQYPHLPPRMAIPARNG
jgi:hypothetical protein